jgi:hypothetical protein
MYNSICGQKSVTPLETVTSDISRVLNEIADGTKPDLTESKLKDPCSSSSEPKTATASSEATATATTATSSELENQVNGIRKVQPLWTKSIGAFKSIIEASEIE